MKKLFTLLTAAFLGVVCSTALSFSQVGGAYYTCLGPFSLPQQNLGFINCVYADGPEANVIYAGSLYGGLWRGIKTVNAEKETWNWKNISDTWKLPGTGISAIEVVPNTDGRVIYIGTHMSGHGRLYGYSNGILKTEDRGLTWKQVGPPVKISELREVDYMKMCPADSMIMLARIGKDFFYTADGWTTYRKIESPLKNTDNSVKLADVEWHPADKKTFYITTRSEAGIKAEFFATNDEGKTWKDMLHGIKAGNIQIDVVNKKGFEHFLFMMYAERGAHLQVFDGTSWSGNINKHPVFNGTGYWNMEFAVNDEDTSVMYVSMTQIAKSINGGKSFVTVSDYWGANTHADVRDLRILKSSSGGKEDVIAMANDGGISISLPGVKDMKSWKSANGFGLSVSQFWGLGTCESDTGIVMGGGQDNGLYTYDAGVWKNQTRSIGDGYETVISETTPVVALGQGNSPTVFSSADRGASWNGTATAPSPATFFERPMLKFNNTAWLGHHQLFMKELVPEKLNNEWIQKSFIPDIYAKEGYMMNSTVSSFAIAANGRNALMAFNQAVWQKDSLKGKLFYTNNLNDEQPVWRDISQFVLYLNWREVYEMCAVPGEENMFYLNMHNPYNGYETETVELTVYDDSVSYKNISYNLPIVPRGKIVAEENSGGSVYVSTDSGIYVSNRAMLGEKKWERFYSAAHPLPFCNISDLEINKATNRLYIATYGRGMWYTPLAELGGDESIIIRKNAEWTSAQKIDGRVVVARGKTLVISAPAYITSKAKIELKKGAKLIIVGGKGALRTSSGSSYDHSKIIRGKRSVVKVK